jgi:hypothetical protein
MIQKQKLKHVVISETNFLALKTLGNKYGYGVTDSLNDVVTMVLREVGSRT